MSNYVQGGSALDREALKRGTSVYLADRVIPMLPERLSNGICSLNQGQDRLTLSCLMDVNEKGKVISHKIAETVIRVDERMCYTDVKNILEDTDEVAKKRYEALIPMFFLMKELSGILRSRRHTRGSIDFDFPESKIILNAAGRAIDVQPYEPMWQPGSLKILCFLPMKPWHRNTAPEIIPLYTEPMKIRIRKRLKVF